MKRFPAIQLAFSLPRIHEAPDKFTPPCPVDDPMLIRLYCVLRLAFPTADLVLSTREPPELRDRLARICITRLSAGSSTAPGGYDDDGRNQPERQQFPVSDHRSPQKLRSLYGEPATMFPGNREGRGAWRVNGTRHAHESRATHQFCLL